MQEKFKIMFNEDPNHHIGEMREARKYMGEDFRITEEMERDFVYQYKGTQLSDYLINVNFMCSAYPSRRGIVMHIGGGRKFRTVLKLITATIMNIIISLSAMA